MQHCSFREQDSVLRREEVRVRQVLSDILAPDCNSFNLVRLAAALSVLISHAYIMLTGLASSEPLSSTPFTLGGHAVNAFFVISGLTLSNSLERRPSLRQYAWARFLRIFPGLFAYGIVFALISGPFLTSFKLSEYFADAHTWLYPFSVLIKSSRAVPPHGIFTTGLFAEAANEPLWTIKYEILAYASLAIFYRFNLLERTPALLFAFAIALTVFMTASSLPESTNGVTWPYHLARFGLCFLLGMIAYRFRDWLSLSPWLFFVSLGLVLICSGTSFAAASAIVLVAHFVFLAGAQNYGVFTSMTRRSDISYGTYIYGWPIQQTLIVLLPGIGSAALAALWLVIVPLFAIASWNLVEKPALEIKHIDFKRFLS